MRLTKVNLGCGETILPYGWLNIDLRKDLKCQETSNLIIADLKSGIPLGSNSVDTIFVSHFLEHLDPFDECRDFLDDCFRILKSDGILRVVVPDFFLIASIYLEDPRSFFQEYGFEKPWFDKARTWNRRLGISVMFDHKMLYDFLSLSEVLEDSGFIAITRVEHPSRGLLPADIHAEITMTHKSHSLVVDARKG